MSGSNPAFTVKANEFMFSFDQPAIEAADLVQKSPTEFNLIHNHRSLNARLLEEDATGKILKIEIDGETYAVEIKDELDQMLQQMGFGTASGKQIKEVKAPMPGMVLEVNVVDGQEVKEGDKLLILGAMKMENSIMIHANAIIKHVAVTAGQAVEKGQVLVELE
jgi:acetyl/propionyl-CoA carboxylase alpha subunit